MQLLLLSSQGGTQGDYYHCFKTVPPGPPFLPPPASWSSASCRLIPPSVPSIRDPFCAMVVGWNLEAVSNPLNDERTVAGRSADGANGKIRSGPAQTCSGHWRGNFSGLGISGISLQSGWSGCRTGNG